MLAPFVLNLLIACTLILLAGWASDSVRHWYRVGHSPAPRSAHAAAGPAWFVANDDVAGWTWRRGMNQRGLREIGQDEWWN